MNAEKLLLADLEYLGSMIRWNEETGERRVTFLISLVTVIIAALVTLATSDIKPVVGIAIATSALFGVLVVGIITYLRMLQRDRVTSEYKMVQDYVREVFADNAQDLEGYILPWEDKKAPWLLRGGLAVTVAGINSLVFTFLVALWVFAWTLSLGWVVWVVAFPVFVVGLVVHWLVRRLYHFPSKRKDEWG